MEQEANKQERFSNTLADFSERLIKYNGALISFQIVLLFAIVSSGEESDGSLTLMVSTVIAGTILSAGSIFSLMLFNGVRATETIEPFFQAGLYQFAVSAFIALFSIYRIGLNLTGDSPWVIGIFASLFFGMVVLNGIIMWIYRKPNQTCEEDK